MTTQVATAAGPFAAAFDALDPASPLHEVRRAAFERFGALGLPTRRDEEWRYTDVRPIAEGAWVRPGGEDVAIPADHLAFSTLTETACHRLVFVNGRLRPDLSDTAGLPAGARLMPLVEAAGSEAAFVEKHLGGYVQTSEEAFTALNTALVEDGAVLHVPARTRLERPVHLVFITEPLPGGAAPMTHPRVLLVLDAASEATVIESYFGPDATPYFTNTVTEIVAGDGAILDHYKIGREGDAGLHVSSLWSHQTAKSNVVSHCITAGGRIVRHTLESSLAGEGCDATFNGLFLTRERQHVDNHLRVRHLEPHGSSREFYKGILDDRSSGVFTGRIFVAEDAQKTDAVQTNMNLLLSDDARVTTKPQLEIFADDVKCTHGATVGQIEESQLFYLRSRGIAEDAARSLLIYAFANETISEIRIPELRRRMQRVLLDRLPHGHVHDDGL